MMLLPAPKADGLRHDLERFAAGIEVLRTSHVEPNGRISLDEANRWAGLIARYEDRLREHWQALRDLGAATDGVAGPVAMAIFKLQLAVLARIVTHE